MGRNKSNNCMCFCLFPLVGQRAQPHPQSVCKASLGAFNIIQAHCYRLIVQTALSRVASRKSRNMEIKKREKPGNAKNQETRTTMRHEQPRNTKTQETRKYQETRNTKKHEAPRNTKTRKREKTKKHEQQQHHFQDKPDRARHEVKRPDIQWR